MSKKPSKHLVPVGTHVPMTTKLTLQAIAESENKSVYEIVQELVQGRVDQYNKELEKLKGKKVTPAKVDDDGEDLLS